MLAEKHCDTLENMINPDGINDAEKLQEYKKRVSLIKSEINKIRSLQSDMHSDTEILESILLYHKNCFRYFKYRILSKICWGKKREHYKLKKHEYREKIRLRKYLK